MNKKIQFYSAIILLLFWIFLATFAPMLAPHDPQNVDLSLKLLKPSKEFIFGTDALGRDIFSRILYGARLSISISVSIQIILLLVSLPIGIYVG